MMKQTENTETDSVIVELSGYTRREITAGNAEVNIKGILISIPILTFFTLPYFFFWKRSLWTGSAPDPLYGTALLLASLFIGIFLHELIHGITWAFFVNGGFKTIRFGFMWKILAPYCNCREPMKLNHYRIGALMPCAILGIFPACIALITGNVFILFFGLIFITAAGGDLFMLWLLRKEGKDQLVLDHPSRVGCFIYDKN
jgi:hypothetical protein